MEQKGRPAGRAEGKLLDEDKEKMKLRRVKCR